MAEVLAREDVGFIEAKSVMGVVGLRYVEEGVNLVLSDAGQVLDTYI